MGKGRLWVTSFIYKYETSTTYALYETMQHFVQINDACEYNLPYPQSAFTHNPGTTWILCPSVVQVTQSIARDYSKPRKTNKKLSVKVAATTIRLKSEAVETFKGSFILLHDVQQRYSVTRWLDYFQYFAIDKDENLPKTLNFAKVCSKCCQTLIKPSIACLRLLTFGQIG